MPNDIGTDRDMKQNPARYTVTLSCPLFLRVSHN